MSELLSATLVAGFTALIWVPVTVNRIDEMGAWAALKNPQPDVRPAADWAYRLARAHHNAVENLVVFAPLAIIVHALELGNGLTAQAGVVFVACRAAHLVIYTLGIPLLRTVAFTIGFGCQAIYAFRILGFV